MKKNICIFCSLSSFNTGMPISTYKLAAGLVESGRFDVCAVLPEAGELCEKMKGAGVRINVIPFKRLRGNPVSLIKFLLTYLPTCFHLYKYIKKNCVDIVHFSDIIDAPFYPIAKLANAKVVAHARVCAGGPVVRYFFNLWTRIFCSRVIAISKFVKRYYGFDDKRALVVYNPGPDRSVFNIDIRKTNRDDIPTIIAVASFRRDKGHHNFLRIASKIKKSIDIPIKIIIAGGKVSGHENYYREMVASAHRLGLDDCLTITGNLPHERIPSIMAKAAILLHVPDWEEALGGVILEAMAMGAVVVAYDSGGVGECFTNGISGFLIKRGCIDDAVDKAVSLLTDDNLRENIVTEARKELETKFSMARYIGGVEEVYDKQ